MGLVIFYKDLITLLFRHLSFKDCFVLSRVSRVCERAFEEYFKHIPMFDKEYKLYNEIGSVLVKHGDVESFKALLARPICNQAYCPNHPLFIAVKTNRIKFVQMIIVDARCIIDAEWFRCFYYAVKNARTSIVKCMCEILEKQNIWHTSCLLTAWAVAKKENHKKIAKILNKQIKFKC